jgi:hypothetical protein
VRTSSAFIRDQTVVIHFADTVARVTVEQLAHDLHVPDHKVQDAIGVLLRRGYLERRADGDFHSADPTLGGDDGE